MGPWWAPGFLTGIVSPSTFVVKEAIGVFSALPAWLQCICRLTTGPDWSSVYE